ncbi:MAG: hypothetical protein Ct9H300mP11_20600 [Chloroflexota bacterium]|nr:MAG: hypothetical protein Ct9H300mP11_20600 [Chloroflexota bacterium]
MGLWSGSQVKDRAIKRLLPEVTLEDVPLFYPFIINNPGEGAQAKRRAHATIVDHLIPPMTTADGYGDIARLEQLMDEHYQCQTLDPGQAAAIGRSDLGHGPPS